MTQNDDDKDRRLILYIALSGYGTLVLIALMVLASVVWGGK